MDEAQPAHVRAGQHARADRRARFVWMGATQEAAAGPLLLIATPVVRVAFSLVAFALQRDRVYTAVTAAVLALLLASLAGG